MILVIDSVMYCLSKAFLSIQCNQCMQLQAREIWLQAIFLSETITRRLTPWPNVDVL
jgi:hypothetical protein